MKAPMPIKVFGTDSAPPCKSCGSTMCMYEVDTRESEPLLSPVIDLSVNVHALCVSCKARSEWWQSSPLESAVECRMRHETEVGRAARVGRY